MRKSALGSPVKRAAFTLVGALVAALSTSACANGCGKAASGARTHVLVSVFPVYDLTRRIAGPDADVTLMVPAGRSEHAFAPTPKDLETAADAKLAVMVGLGLDPWMEDVMKHAPDGARVLKVGDRVPTLTVASGTEDPHVWLDPQRTQLVVRAIAEELGRIDAKHALAYRSRASELDALLASLDKEAEARTSTLKKRGFVTFHESFRYFAERYGLDVVGVVEPVPGAEPTPDHEQKMRELVKEKKVRAVFQEPQLDAGRARFLAREASAPLGMLDPVGGGPETDSYEKLIRFDVAQLEKHLP